MDDMDFIWFKNILSVKMLANPLFNLLLQVGVLTTIASAKYFSIDARLALACFFYKKVRK